MRAKSFFIPPVADKSILNVFIKRVGLMVRGVGRVVIKGENTAIPKDLMNIIRCVA